MDDVLLAVVTLVGIGFFLFAPTAFVVRTLWRSRLVGRAMVVLAIGLFLVAAISFQLEVGPHSLSRERAVAAAVVVWALMIYGGGLAYGVARAFLSIWRALVQKAPPHLGEAVKNAKHAP
jgi:hypothetical protein